MGTRWIDVSIPMEEGMAVWPGDPAFRLTPLTRMKNGDSANTSWLSLGTHTGTHIDAPWHIDDSARRLDEIDPAIYFGDAGILDLNGIGKVSAEHLESHVPLPPRILLKTSNSNFPADAPFEQDYVALDATAAELLVQEGVRLLGMDYLSVDVYERTDNEVHQRLLSNGVLVVEGLRLRAAPPGIHLFTVLPLPLTAADGAPCRAFVGVREDDA